MNFEKIKELLNCYNANEQINMKENENYLDKLMKYNGSSIGFSGHSNDFFTTLKNLSSDSKAAKGVFIKFIINDNIKVSALENIMVTIQNFISKKPTLVFDTDINNNILCNEFQFQILITGIKR
ncbi:MAG: hypothetical protein AB7D96_06115 [Arcobacteraceae bacterium]